jgi:hypothetical protein
MASERPYYYVEDDRNSSRCEDGKVSDSADDDEEEGESDGSRHREAADFVLHRLGDLHRNIRLLKVHAAQKGTISCCIISI